MPGLPSLDTLLQWYRDESGYDPAPDLAWGQAFNGLRGGVIMQGIAARYALRQASGVTARNYAEMMHPYGEVTWTMVEKLIEDGKEKEKEKEGKGGGPKL